jgi:hypothetical protein
MALQVISKKGCPYGDRLRIFMDKMEQKYEFSDKNDALSGTLSMDGNLSNDIIEVLTFFNVIQSIPDNVRERHLKLADKFDSTVIRYFNEAMMDPVNRGNGYHMMMEYLCEFENELSRCGMYFGGSEPGFLDFQIYPWMARIGIWTPEFMKVEHCRLQSWRRRMKTNELVTSDKMKSSRSDMLKFAKNLRAESIEARSHKLKRFDSVDSGCSMTCSLSDSTMSE